MQSLILSKDTNLLAKNALTKTTSTSSAKLAMKTIMENRLNQGKRLSSIPETQIKSKIANNLTIKKKDTVSPSTT